MRALVTGASHGIGGATCRKLLKDALGRGEAISIAAAATGLKPDLCELVDELNASGARAIALSGDLAQREVPARLVAQAVEFCGGLDALVCNAGTGQQASLLELSEDDWDRVFQVNVKAAWQLARAAYPYLKASRGAIVAVSSIAGIVPFPDYAPYAISKAALIMLCEQLAHEWGTDGIRVNCVAPGITRTPRKEQVYADAEVAARRNAAVPLGRVAAPADIAGAIAFLLGPDAGYITGQNLRVDGGFATSIMRTVPGGPPPQTR